MAKGFDLSIKGWGFPSVLAGLGVIVLAFDPTLGKGMIIIAVGIYVWTYWVKYSGRR